MDTLQLIAKALLDLDRVDRTAPSVRCALARARDAPAPQEEAATPPKPAKKRTTKPKPTPEA